MKLFFNSVIFPLLLIIALLIFTGWMNKITSYDLRDLNQGGNPATVMFNAEIESYGMQGELANNVKAARIEEAEESNIYHLTDANIKLYKNGKIAQKILSRKADYDANTKIINVSGSYQQQDKNNRLEIIINEF